MAARHRARGVASPPWLTSPGAAFTVTNRVVILRGLISHFGLSWVLSRLRYFLKLRGGHFRRALPLQGWDSIGGGDLFSGPAPRGPEQYLSYRRGGAPSFFFSGRDFAAFQRYFGQWDQGVAGPEASCRELAGGRITLFGGLRLQTGFPPDWHRNHQNGKVSPAAIHWSQIPDFQFGDIKLIWEMSRFGFTFAMARAHARTGRDEYAEMFWLALEDWLRCNPPQSGANWKCGQEIAIRLIAWCFGLYSFLGSEASTGPRLLLLARAMHYFGRRIEANIAYALSQNNNHGISEAAGLWTIGTLFPELKSAARWRRLGGGLLEEQARKLICDDGSFSQQSANYHRMVLQLYSWVLGLGQRNGQEFSPGLGDRLRRALVWSYQLMDLGSGGMPNSGGNDSALLLPLTNCDWNDHRPTLQALSRLLNRELLFPAGPWDEEALWLSGPNALHAPRRTGGQGDFWGGKGGFHVLRNPQAWAVLRCGPYRHRPVHADLLHLDVWWRGQNVALDPGTYSYNAEGPWRLGQAGTEYHNTVTVDQRDQMDKAGRFLWMPWAESTFLGAKRSAKGHLAWMEGVHQGYRRLPGGPVHRRMVFGLGGEWWLVLDSLTGDGDHHYRLHWLFKDAPHVWGEAAQGLTLDYPPGKYQVMVGARENPAAVDLRRADPGSPQGWCSPCYQSREPAISLALETSGSRTEFWTAMGPAGFQLSSDGDAFILETEGLNAHVELREGTRDGGPSSGFIRLEGKCQDHLSLP